MRRLGVLLALLVCVLAAGAGDAGARRRPKNPRNRRIEHKKSRTRTRRPAKTKPKLGKYLHSKSWDPEVRRALEALIDRLGSGSQGYDPKRPPAAVISLDDNAIVGDLGLTVFQRLVDKVEFKYSSAFWELVPVGFGRHRLRTGYRLFRGEPVSVWKDQPAYGQYRRQLYRTYRDLCRRRSVKECRAFLASLWLGFTADEVGAYTRLAVQEALRAPLDSEMIQERPDDPDPVMLRSGLRIVPEFKNLVAALNRYGFDVRLISSAARLEVAEMAAEFGLEPAKAVGLEVTMSTTTHIVLGEVLEPVPVGPGRAAALAHRLGREPALTVGSGGGDLELLRYGRGTKLLIDSGDSALREIAAEKRWLVQPRFK